MYDVITIGAATQDVFLVCNGLYFMKHPREKYALGCFPLGGKINLDKIYFETGGGATNAAVTFANLGMNVRIIARVGDDVAGERVSQDLRRSRLSTVWVRTVAGGTTAYSAILLTPSGDRTSFVHRGVSASFTEHDIPWSRLRARWLYVTTLGGDLKLLQKIFQTACAHGVSVAFNPGIRDLACGLREIRTRCSTGQVLSLNRDEAAILSGGERNIRRIRKILFPYLSNAVIVTDGAKGAYYWDRNHFLWARSPHVNVVNSTGAGDAFGSGFISGILRWHDPVRALQLATLNAVGTIQQMGAKRGLLTKWPLLNELNQLKVIKM